MENYYKVFFSFIFHSINTTTYLITSIISNAESISLLNKTIIKCISYRNQNIRTWMSAMQYNVEIS